MKLTELIRAYWPTNDCSTREKCSDCSYDGLNSVEVPDISLTDFRDHGKILTIHSQVLGEAIRLVAQAGLADGTTGPTVYTPDEFSILSSLSPAFIRRVHHLKQMVEGEIVGVRMIYEEEDSSA